MGYDKGTIYFWYVQGCNPFHGLIWGIPYMTQALRLHATLTPAYYKELPLRGSYSHSELNHIVGRSCEARPVLRITPHQIPPYGVKHDNRQVLNEGESPNATPVYTRDTIKHNPHSGLN